jgi:hypothetical protein
MGLEQADSFILDPHKWLFTPFDCCALLYRDPGWPRRTQDASYLDVIHTPTERNPSDYAYQLTAGRRGRCGSPRGERPRGMKRHRGRRPGAAYRRAHQGRTAAGTDPRARPRGDAVPQAGQEDYDAWAQRLHADQVAFIPPTKWEGETVGRFAFLHPHTHLELVRGAGQNQWRGVFD